jgi:uncharacterized protein
MSDIDQQFIEYVVKSLVGKPDAVHIDRRIDEKGVLLELTVDPEDLGRVIGKRGATAQSLRTLLRALGTKNDARYNLKIVDNGTGRPSSDSDGQGSDNHADAPAPHSDNAADAASDDTKVITDEHTDEAAVTATVPPEAEQTPKAESQPEETEAAPEDQTSDRLRAAREELADLDDLDV